MPTFFIKKENFKKVLTKAVLSFMLKLVREFLLKGETYGRKDLSLDFARKH